MKISYQLTVSALVAFAPAFHLVYAQSCTTGACTTTGGIPNINDVYPLCQCGCTQNSIVSCAQTGGTVISVNRFTSSARCVCSCSNSNPNSCQSSGGLLTGGSSSDTCGCDCSDVDCGGAAATSSFGSGGYTCTCPPTPDPTPDPTPAPFASTVDILVRSDVPPEVDGETFIALVSIEVTPATETLFAFPSDDLYDPLVVTAAGLDAAPGVTHVVEVPLTTSGVNQLQAEVSLFLLFMEDQAVSDVNIKLERDFNVFASIDNQFGSESPNIVSSVAQAGAGRVDGDGPVSVLQIECGEGIPCGGATPFFYTPGEAIDFFITAPYPLFAKDFVLATLSLADDAGNQLQELGVVNFGTVSPNAESIQTGSESQPLGLLGLVIPPRMLPGYTDMYVSGQTLTFTGVVEMGTANTRRSLKEDDGTFQLKIIPVLGATTGQPSFGWKEGLFVAAMIVCSAFVIYFVHRLMGDRSPFKKCCFFCARGGAESVPVDSSDPTADNKFVYEGEGSDSCTEEDDLGDAVKAGA
mmetsp:Transcript_13053/g.31849  ORF Transcript_13053/g.31849 Transcript_13053/m.31849 type:complete len:523 (-) Transcript_13053:185-1753(-)|eukprot:CAMPEP_0113447160 /NCGR_PEP_ID=MMETSP0014_2-20120614/4092_1 /TAXON_ID=2857 /ORGANISM="Nitzschia sp." /LENGTH=522 /DNA_ID=CAMNT_0000338301 /DNA_START=792 /DNA_END=2360 /DNA_ORIENTATION=+ /assembly_acc=CAM_ASM_000159